MIVFIFRHGWKGTNIGLTAQAETVLDIDEGSVLKDRSGKMGRRFDAVGLRAVLRILSNGEEIPLPEDVRAKAMLEGNDRR
jgi:hypothetical protein